MVIEVFVQEDGYILIVWISFYFIVWSAGESVCSIGGSWFVFKLNVILGNFRDISHYVWSDFSWFSVVSQVCVICVYQDRNFGSFKQVRPAS
jgi:hypothetical protein